MQDRHVTTHNWQEVSYGLPIPISVPFSTTLKDFTEPRDSEWQWHQLGHMQVCSSLQTDNHACTPPLLQDFSNAIREHLCDISHGFNWHNMLHGPSVIAELLCISDTLGWATGRTFCLLNWVPKIHFQNNWKKQAQLHHVHLDSGH